MAAPRDMRRTRDGFTLIEAVITMLVLLLLIGLAAPGMRSVMVTQGIRAASTDLYATLALARSEAIMRNEPVSVAPVNGDWKQGWTVAEESGTVIRRQNAPRHIEVTGPPAVTFSSEGRPDLVRPPFELAAGDLDDTHARCVKLNLGGRPTIGKGPCS
ncbi:MAG TPA: GspH/FimT family pseudopilin [Burkholderiales bacterium]|nr:GspH/FimT family pseudopilin [Burkholderiales bacterium]